MAVFFGGYHSMFMFNDSIVISSLSFVVFGASINV